MLLVQSPVMFYVSWTGCLESREERRHDDQHGKCRRNLLEYVHYYR